MELTRQALYDWVWREPVAAVALSLGISGSGLKRLCERHAIPTPPKGYWRQVQTGQVLPRAPLPASELSTEAAIPELRKRKTYAGVLDHKTDESKSDIPSVEVSAQPPAKSRESSDLSELMRLADIYDSVERARRFLSALESSSRSLDPATAAVLIMRLGRARHELSQFDPSSQVIESCTRVARGLDVPFWWRELTATFPNRGEFPER